jgi:hypothetical protein
MRTESAVVYVPHTITDPDQVAALTAPCLEHSASRGYRMWGIVRSWPDAVAALKAGHAQVLVVADRSLLPARRRPRLEVPGDGQPRCQVGRRRPRPVSR